MRGARRTTAVPGAGYSERSMFRHLAQVYRILDASDRDQALLAARELGLCDVKSSGIVETMTDR
jgi:hypothetical protein